VVKAAFQNMPEELRLRRAKALRQFWRQKPLGAFDDLFANTQVLVTNQQELFSIPPDVSLTGSDSLSTMFTKLLKMLSDQFAPQVEDAFPPNAWPGALIRGVTVIGATNVNPNPWSFEKLYDLPQMGPLGYLAATTVLSAFQNRQGVLFGCRGLEHLQTSEFQKECEMLIGKGAWSEKAILGVLRAFGNLKTDDRKVLAEMFGEQYNKEILEIVERFATTNREGDRDQLFYVLDLIWEKSLRGSVDDTLCDEISLYDPVLLSLKGLRFRDFFYNEGMAFLNGQGRPTDCEQAVQWFRRAERLGNSCAAYKLGNCYEQGKGCETNIVEAIKNYLKAAESGCAESQFALGRCLKSHSSGTNDAIEAFAWLGMAGTNGQNQATALRDELQTHLAKSELQLGRIRFDELCRQITNKFNCLEH
jgi:hypothetical protein